MQSFELTFDSKDGGYYPVLLQAGRAGPTLTVPHPVRCRYLSGAADSRAYDTARELEPGVWACGASWTRSGFTFQLSDTWRVTAKEKLRLERRLEAHPSVGQVPDGVEGIQLHLACQLASLPEGEWRFFAPALLYAPDQREGEQTVVLSDERLAYPLITGYQPSSGFALCLSRVDLPAFDTAPLRPEKEHQFLQKTDVGALGYSSLPQALLLHAYWPYCEGEKSASLDSAGSAPSAFYPLDASGLKISLVYEALLLEAETFADVVFGAFKNAYSLAAPTAPSLPFSLREAIAYRAASLAKTYQEWEDGGAAFIFSFNPQVGYEAPARGFGASFTDHEMGESREILEYGFTGRQLNAAYMLADLYGGAWRERGRRVVDFFVNHCATASGWLYSIYHLGKRRPLYTVGDPAGPVMHYLARSAQPANYTRMMVEVAFDLLLNYRLHRGGGAFTERWLEAARRFGDFLVAAQNPDGSWYRAYTPEGEPIRSNQWFGEEAEASKSATAIPVWYLVELATEVPDREAAYVEAARQAGDYLLEHHVQTDLYRGGTLDNPNVVDKEAAMYAMRALLSLYERLQERAYLDGAHRAAQLAITWNSIWNVPRRAGTPLHRVGVQSTGWGGINSIWGAGVTDIYSLFFLSDFVQLSRLTGERLYADVAELVAYGTQQILSYPGDLMGFADIGMQPEGIAWCSQGVDEGLIAKGDIWGGLGWIYAAGTFGLTSYLIEKERTM